jgi:hypothetical protein
MKTIANCTPKEFAVQTLKIANRIKTYADGIKKLKESAENGESDIFAIINYVCDGNVDETMEICGALCFMTGDEFANLNPENGDEDGILALVDIANSARCVRFFITLLQLEKLTKKQ